MWTTLSLTRKMSITTPPARQTTPNGVWYEWFHVYICLCSRWLEIKIHHWYATGFLSQFNLNCTSALLACFMFDCQVDVQFERMLKRFIPLSELKKIHLQHKAKGGSLNGMALFTRARLSVQPLTRGTWRSVTLSNMVVKSPPHHSLQSFCLSKIIY